jgi:hypothetical protein
MESSSRVNVSNPSASKKATSIASAITSFASRISESSSARLLSAGFLLLGLVVGIPVPSGLADVVDPDSPAARLEHRLADLEARDDAKYAKGALEQARRALLRASSSPEDSSGAARARRIADAALRLADRQLARRRAQAELFATQRRLSSIRERANAQRRVLEALMRDRASLARSAEQP